MKPLVGKEIQIQSYKHDETLHRIWEKATVVDQADDYVVVVNKRTKVIEANGRFWHTREPSVTWFFTNRWFNIIGIIKKDSVHFYCNIASPFIIDQEALKYIDYDLDIKVIDDFTYTTLDRNEYNKHKTKMDYPVELKLILEQELSLLKKRIENHVFPFDHELVKAYYNRYLEDAPDE